jgi:hypothetical protein
LAGAIELLLDAHQVGGVPEHLNEALSLAHLLAAFAQWRGGRLVWPSESPEVFTADYHVGYAGVASTLLRLADPHRRPHALSRAGFRYSKQSSSGVNTDLFGDASAVSDPQ